jgi:hypothetical protein
LRQDVATVYVELLEEGVQVWRPVSAIHEGGCIYRLPLMLAREMAGEVWAFAPGSLVHCEMRDFSDSAGLVATRQANAADLKAVLDISKLRSGIDLLIKGRPALGCFISALEAVAGIKPDAVKLPQDHEDKRLELFDHTAWAVVHAFEAGDFGYKIDLDGIEPQDYVTIARQLAQALNVAIAWPDETTLAATAFKICHPDGREHPVTLDDCAPDGFTVTKK